MNTCRSCGAPIMWAATPKGRRMPMDPEPTPAGNRQLVDRAGLAPLSLAVDATTPPEVPRYTAHFATCPNAQAHRKGGKK